MKVFQTNGMLIEEQISKGDIDFSNRTISLKNASGVGYGYIINH